MIDEIEKHLKIVRIDDDTYCVFGERPFASESICIMMDRSQYNDLLAVVPNIPVSYENENKRGLWHAYTGETWEHIPGICVSCGPYDIFRIYHPSMDHVKKLYDILKKGLNAPKLLWKDRDIFDGHRRYIIKDNNIKETWEYRNEL